MNEKEAISFDHTIKGHRVVKQVMIKKESHEKAVEKYGEVSGEWDTIIIKDRKFIQKYHVKWIDCDKLDIVNGETWETVWEKTIDDDIDDELLSYSRLISDNYNNLNKFSKELVSFETLLSKEIAKYE